MQVPVLRARRSTRARGYGVKTEPLRLRSCAAGCCGTRSCVTVMVRRSTAEEVGAMDVILKVIEGAKIGRQDRRQEERIHDRPQPGVPPLRGSQRRQPAALCDPPRRESRRRSRTSAAATARSSTARRSTARSSSPPATRSPSARSSSWSRSSPGINNVKKPEVKTVAEAVERTAEAARRRRERRRHLASGCSARSVGAQRNADDPHRRHERGAAQQGAGSRDGGDGTPPTAAEAAEWRAPSDRRRKPGKRGPGKLPKLPQQPSSKDSREAAVEALRAWSRRR